METRPLLSIAIATKNRVNYCINTIDTILKYKNQNFELIIQDNTDNRDLEDYVKKNYTDSRLKYRYTPPPFSSIDNFNAVLELCTGEYVCLLGDDDGIVENIFPVVEWAKANNVYSLCPKEFVHFIWPNESTNGKMVIPYSTHKLWENKPAQNIQDLVDDGIVMYMKFNMPKLYHGLVRRDLLERMKQKNGYYLGGLSPDIYACVALASLAKKHIVLDSPITIAGACPKSTTIDQTKGKHSGRIEDAPHLRSREEYVWDENVPRYYSVETIWAESAIKAIKEFDIPVDLSKLNRTKILASAMNTAPGYKQLFLDETFKISKKKENNLQLNILRRKLFIESFTKKVVNRIPRKYIFKHYRFTGVKDIERATEISNEVLNKLEISSILAQYKGESRKM